MVLSVMYCQRKVFKIHKINLVANWLDRNIICIFLGKYSPKYFKKINGKKIPFSEEKGQLYISLGNRTQINIEMSHVMSTDLEQKMMMVWHIIFFDRNFH